MYTELCPKTCCSTKYIIENKHLHMEVFYNIIIVLDYYVC